MFAFVALAMIIVQCNGKSSKEKYPISTTPGGPPDPLLVKKLYDNKCAICHGFDGRQQYAGAKDLGASTLSRDQVITQISDGKGTMPPQKDVLGPEQIAALADFVLTLRSK
jgi:cytochrome c553